MKLTDENLYDLGLHQPEPLSDVVDVKDKWYEGKLEFRVIQLDGVYYKYQYHTMEDETCPVTEDYVILNEVKRDNSKANGWSAVN